MHNTNTRFWKKSTLNQFVHEDDSSLTAVSLIMMGVLVALMHQHLRLGLNIPGHHGLEWMTLLLFGRMQSRQHWAGLTIAVGAAATYMTYATYMPLAHTFKPALVYLLNGACLDILFRITPKNLPVILKGMIFGGISFIIQPFMLVPLALLIDISFGSYIKHGFLYPVLTHFMFGSVGAITGICFANIVSRPGKIPGRKHPDF